MSFRNRLWIAGATGQMNLSVPITDSRNEKQLYKDVKLVPGRWQTDHFRTLVSCYNRSPWFEYYRDDLAVLYSTPFNYLFDWNLACFDFTTQHLKSTCTRRVLPDGCHPTGNTRRVEIRPGNKKEWLSLGAQPKKYVQVFEERVGFIPGLSILDLMFCEGPAALSKLEDY